MPKFKNGDPQLTFKKKDGSTFTKTYHSASAARKSILGWKANGGRTPKLKKFSRK